jgi:transcriptional regulator with PAS, ATPase and Fis domain
MAERLPVTESCEIFPQESAVRRPVLVQAGSATARGACLADRLLVIDGRLEIGRSPPRDGGVRGWQIDDPRVSALHASVAASGTVVTLSDAGSRNGTLLDGRRLERPAKLHDGELIYVAGHAAVFRWLTDAEIEAIEEDRVARLGPVSTGSRLLAAALWRLRRLAPGQQPILLIGATGVGKEVYARAAHEASGRSGPFVGVNCAAIPAELAESELFGYVRGAHSQAQHAKRGLVEHAEGGTLFLDEIGDMPTGVQAKLLRFAESGEMLPLGATRAVHVDVRLMAATSQPGPAGLAPGLRADLAGRLAAEPITLPPLAARREDIGPLISHFLSGEDRRLAPAAFLALLLHDWPKNVRELARVIREAATFAGPGRDGAAAAIELAHLPAAIAQRLSTPARPRRRSPRPAPSREQIEALLSRHQGNVAEVARALDRHWAVVSRLLHRYGLDPDQWRPAE